VDNELTEVLINGVSVGINDSSSEKFTPFSIAHGFIAGVNALEFVTRNDLVRQAPNPQGLRVEMELDSAANR